jgi:hypothetical protein
MTKVLTCGQEISLNKEDQQEASELPIAGGCLRYVPRCDEPRRMRGFSRA